MEEEKHCIEIFNQLFINYKRKFVHFAQTYVNDITIAEDIAMESMIDYWENRNSLPDDSNIPAYILTIIKHKCLNYLQHLRTTEKVTKYLKDCSDWELDLRISTLEACNPERIFCDEIQKIVEETLQKLPLQTREIFIRSRYNNQSHKEIAEALEISTKSVEFHLTKALKVLRIALKDYFPILFFFPHIYR